MTTTERTTAVGVFTEHALADSAMNDLRNAGFSAEQIGFLSPDQRVKGSDSGAGDVATGAVSGGVIGGAVGAAISLLIPGLGVALAGGILAGVLVGVVAGGLVGTLVSMGVPEDEAQYYQDELAQGRTLVTVKAPGRYQEALSILRRNGAYDASVRTDVPETTTAPAAPEYPAAYPGPFPPVNTPGTGATGVSTPPVPPVTYQEETAQAAGRQDAEAQEQEATQVRPEPPGALPEEEKPDYNPNIPQ